MASRWAGTSERSCQASAPARDGGDGERREADAAAQRMDQVGQLEVLRQQEAERREAAGDSRPDSPVGRQQARADHEGRPQGEQVDELPRVHAPGLHLDDQDRQCDQSRRERERGATGGRPVGLGAAAVDERRRGEDRGDRHARPEVEVPPVVLGELAADQRAERERGERERGGRGLRPARLRQRQRQRASRMARPAPSTARPVTRVEVESAVAQTTDPIAAASPPATASRRRSMRARATASSTAASASRYAFITHCPPEADEPRSTRIVGSRTPTAVTSSSTTATAAEAAARLITRSRPRGRVPARADRRSGGRPRSGRSCRAPGRRLPRA